jgi:DNA processing protein
LSRGVLVTEAGKKSGTLITVTQAIEQGREVFAVPGNISSRLSEGTNDLIRDGATPASNYSDILFALKISPAEKILPEKKFDLAPDEKQVYDTLSFDPATMDELLEKTGFNPGRVMLVLTQLEIKGLAKKIAGARYTRI